MHCNNGLNNKLVESLVENKVAQETGDLKYLQDSMHEFVKTLKEIILGEYSPEFFNKYVDEALKLHGSNLEEFLKIPKMGLELRQALNSIDEAIDTSNQEFKDNLVLLLDRFQTTLDNIVFEARDAYETALDNGFEGTKQEWLEHLEGDSAYKLATLKGFQGTEQQWLDHLEGDSAYEIAVKNGYIGTQAQWLKYIRADGFIQSIQQFATNDAETQVQIPDYGTINSLQGYIKDLFESGGLPATPFKTLADLNDSDLPEGSYAVVTEDIDTQNRGIYFHTTEGFVKSKYDHYKDFQDLLDSRTGYSTTKASGYPVILDKNMQSPLWVNSDGLIGFSGLDKKTQDTFGVGTTPNIANISYVPLVVDSAGNVPVWLKDGLLGVAGFTPDSLSEVIAGLNFDSLITKEVFDEHVKLTETDTRHSPRTISTDGTTLRKWKTKLARIRLGNAEQLRVGLIGDSWMAMQEIPNGFHKHFSSELDLPVVSAGWISCVGISLNIDSISHTGAWTIHDMSSHFTEPMPVNSPPPDGNTLESSEVGATWTLDGMPQGQECILFFGGIDAKINITLNDGSPVEIDIGEGAVYNNTYKLDLDQVSNKVTVEIITGTVMIYGAHLRHPTETGLEINKLGNGSTLGRQLGRVWRTVNPDCMQVLDLDVVVVIFGTNDAGVYDTPRDLFKNGIKTLISGIRAHNPNCGIILTVPSCALEPRLHRYERFRDVMYEVAMEEATEFYNMLDDWEIGNEPETSYGTWLPDKIHVSEVGGYTLATAILNKFLEG